ncbi:hypothetical protein U9M48_020804 [Paspalum notatum var. saurae]|uniref:Uncharacterized protein n=1 Tax=Paspalum notatum var. saurae TaxID=547442 RepID=A0AAQ3TF15_PASNO
MTELQALDDFLTRKTSVSTVLDCSDAFRIFKPCTLQLHCLLLEHADVGDAKGAEEGDAGDGGHGRHLEIIHHHLRHDALYKPLAAGMARRLCCSAGRRHSTRRTARVHNEDHLPGHLAAAIVKLTTGATHIRHVCLTLGVAIVAATVKFSRGLRLWQLEQLAAVEAAGRREQGALGVGGADVGLVQLLDAAVEVADGADHGVLAQDLDDRADGQREEGEEEVHDVLAGLRVQHALALDVDQKLHA